MKFFSTGLLLLIVFGSLEGSTIPHKRTVRALNATIQTHFNGTIQRRNPCNDKEVERSSYKGCHEFHHHSKESNWSDYSRKCATLISDFFHAISNLVTFKDRQSGTFDLNINTKVSHKTDGDCADTKKPICPTPAAIAESTDCEVLPSTSCDDLPGKDLHIKGSEICFTKKTVKVDEEDDKCSVGSETSVNGEPQTADSSLLPENDKCIDVSYSVEKIPEPTVKTTPELQPTQEVNLPETKPQSEDIPPETIPTYDNYSSSEETSETTNDKSASITVKPDSVVPSSTVTTSAPKEFIYIDVSEIPQQPAETESGVQETSDSKDYLSDYKSQTDEEKTIQPSSSATQPENSSDEDVSDDDDESIEFSDKLAVFNVHEPQQESFQTFSPSTQHYSSDTTTPSTLKVKSDYDYVQDMPEKTQPTLPPLYQSEQYDEPVQSAQAVTFAPVQPEPENYVNQYDQVASDLPTSFPPKGEDSLEFSAQLPVYNVRQPQPESPPSSSLTNEPTSIQPPALPESHSENYVNYEDGLVLSQLPTSTSPPKVEEPSIEFSDKLAIYNVRQPYGEPTSIQPDNYDDYEDESNESTSSSPIADLEPSIEFSDQLAVYNIRTPTTTYPPSSVSHIEPSTIQPSVSFETQTANYVDYEDRKPSSTFPPSEESEPSIEFSDQLAVYNVREPLASTTTTPYPFVTSSIQSSASQPDNYVNYETEFVPSQVPTTSTPKHEDQQYLEYSDQLAVYNVREPLPSTTTSSPVATSSIQPSSSQSDIYVNYENDLVRNQVPTTSSPKHEDQQYLEYSDQLAVYNVREPVPSTTTSFPVVTSSIQPSTSESDNDESYDDDDVEQQTSTLPSPQPGEDQYFEYSDQLAAYNVREQLPSTTTSSPVATSSIQPSASQSDIYVNYENDLVPNQVPTTSSPKHEDQQYLEYSDQLAVFNVREPLPSTTTSSPTVSENIPSGFGTTLPPAFPSYELDTLNDQRTEVEPQPTFSPKLEEETHNFQPVTGQPQPSNEPATEYYGEYNEQTFSNQMPSFTTPAGKVYPTMVPSSEYVNINVPEYPSADYSSSQGIGGFVSTSLPSPSYDTSSVNNFELQYDSQPTSTLRPTQPEQNQVFSDQVSDIREPQSDSYVSDGRISDMVTEISPVSESESSILYDDESSNDSQQKPITNEYPESLSTNQPLPNNYEIYDEAPMTSANEPTTYQRFPIDVITTSPSSTEPETYAIYDDPKFSAESQGTYPPKIENESFANYDDYNDTSTTGQASVSIEPLSDSDSSENEPNSSEEGPSSEEEDEEKDGNDAVRDDKGLLPLSPNTFRPTVQIETTVNYADQTPFRPIRLPSSIGPLQENNIIYDEGILRNETEPSDLGGEEAADNSLTVSGDLKNQNEGKELDSSTTLAPELEFDTYYEETFKQPSSSDAPKINNYVIYEDDEQPSSPKFDQNTTISNDYSTSVFPSTTSLPQQIVTTPSTSEPMPETYSEYGYSKTDFNSQTTFPPQTESVLYDDHSTQDQSLTQQEQQQEPVDYATYGNQIQSTSTAVPTHQEMIDISDELSIYNVPETVLKSSSPLSELLSSNMVTTTQPSIPSDEKNVEIEIQPTFSPSVEPQSYDEQRPSPSKDLNSYTYINYEDTISSIQLPTTPLTPNEVEPSLEYSDQLPVYDVRQPQPESPSSSSLTNEPTSIQPPALPESHYVNYEDGLVLSQLPTSTSPPKVEEPSIEYSDQLAVYNVRQPNMEPTSTEPTFSETDNYDSYEDETESNGSTTPSSSTVIVEPSLQYSDEALIYNVHLPRPQFSSPSPPLDENIPKMIISTLPPSSINEETTSVQPTASQAELESEDDYDDEITSNYSLTTLSTPTEEPSIELTDELAIYDVRQPSTVSPLSSVSYLEPSSTQTPFAPEPLPETYVSYEDGRPSTQIPTKSPQPQENEYLEYSDELAVYNVREPLPSTTTLSPVVTSSIQPSSSQSESYVNYETEFVPSQVPTTSSPKHDNEQYLEYSDQLAAYNVQEPLPSTTTSSPLVTSSTQPSASQSDIYVNYENDLVPNQVPTTSSPQHEEEQYLEYSDQLAVYNVREPLPSTTTSSPVVTSSVQPSTSESDNDESYDDDDVEQQTSTLSSPQPGDEQYLEYSDQLAVYNVRDQLPSTTTLSPLITSSTRPSASQSDSYVNYETEFVPNQVPTTSSPKHEDQQYLEYSDQLAVYNVREPLPSTTTSSPPVQPSASQSDIYVNYENDLVPNQVPTTFSPKHEEDQYLEYSDQLAVYNVREPLPSTTTSSPLLTSSLQPSTSESDSDESYEDDVEQQTSTLPSPKPQENEYLEYSDQLAVYNVREPLPSTTTSSPLVTSSIQPSALQPDNYMNYENDFVPNQVPTTSSPKHGDEQYLEYSDQLAVYNVREPLPGTTTLSPLVTSSVQPSTSESDNDESYDDEDVVQQTSTLSSPQPGDEQYLEYSDQLAVYNVRDQLPSTTTSSPAVGENIPSSFATTLAPLFSSDRIETYDDPTVRNELQGTLAPEMYDQPTSPPATSFSPSETQLENYGKGELPTSSFPPKSIDPFLEYSDQLSIYNVRQPEYHSSSPSPVSEIPVTTTVPNLPSDDFGTYDSPVEYTDSQPTFPSQSESQRYHEPTSVPSSSVSQSDVYTNYDDSIRQPYFETTPSSPSEIENVSSGAMSVSTTVPFPGSDSFQAYNSPVTSSDHSSQLVPESQVNYEDYTVQKEELPSTPSTFNLAQSQDLTIPPSNYSAEQEFDYNPTSPPQSQDTYINYEDQTVSNAIPTTTSSPVKEVEPSLEYSDQLAVYNVREPVFESTTTPVVSIITTLSPPSLTDTVTSPQPSPSESQSDSDEEYEDETSTTLSTPVQVEPSVEYSDELAAFNVLGPVIVPIPATVVKDNIPSGDVTTSLPSSSQSPSESQSDSVEDYEDETASTPSPVIGDEPSLEVSDEVSVYNVRQRPSQLSSPSPPSENIPSEAVTTFAPYLPSDKFESYDYQPVGFESQPTFPPVAESQMYNEPTSVLSTSSQSQDNYVNYGDEIVPMTTLRPSVEPSLEYSDGLAIYNVQSPFSPSSSPSPLLNENIAVDTVPTFMPAPVYDAPTSAPSTSPEQQPDNYVNYEDQLPSNEFVITYSPAKEESPMTSSDQLSTYTASPQSLPSDGYDYDNQLPTTSSPKHEDEQYLEYSDQLAVYNVREPLPSTTTSSPLVTSTLQPSTSESDNDESYEDDVEQQTSTLPSPKPQENEYLEYSDQLAVYNVRDQLPSTTTSSPLVTSSIQPSTLQPDNYMNYENDLVPNQVPTTFSPKHEDQQYLEYSDQLAVYNVREPVPSTTTSSPLVTSSIQPSASESDSDESYDDDSVEQQTSTLSSPQPGDEQYLEYSDQLAVYNVREQLPSTTTSSPVVTSSIQPSASQSDSYVNYENDLVPSQVPTTSSPKHEDEQYLEYSDQLAVYNVREPLPSTTTSSPTVSENIPSHEMVTSSPFVTSSIQSSTSQSDTYLNYETEFVPNQVPTTSSPKHEDEQYLEYSDQLAGYNVKEPLPSTTTSSPLVTSSTQPSDSQSHNYVNYEYDLVPNQVPTTSSPKHEEEQYLEYSDQLAVYNVREPLQSTTTLSPLITNSVQPSTSESDNDESYEDDVEQQTSTLPSPQPGEEQYLEYSDQLAVYNVRDQLPSTTTLFPLITSSTGPSASQSDNYVNYETEFVPNQVPTTSSPKHEDQQYLEYSDQLAVYNVREPLPSTTTLSPAVQPSASLSDNYINYENDLVRNQVPTTSTPKHEDQQYLEYSDQLPVYNVREPVLSTTTSSPLLTSSLQPSTSESDSDETYDDEDVEQQTSTLPSPQPQENEYLEYSDQLAVYNVREQFPSTSTSSPLVTSSIQPSASQSDNYVNYDIDLVPNQVPSTSPPLISENVAYSVVTTLSPSPSSLSVEPISVQPSISESQSESDEDYEDKTSSNEFSTTLSPSVQVEPSVEYLDEVAVYNVRQPLPGTTTSAPVVDENIANGLITTLSPSPSNLQSASYSYVDYKDEMVSKESPTTLSTPIELEPSLEYSDEVIINNVRQPGYSSSSPSPMTENIASDFQPTFSPQSDSLMYSEPTSVPTSSSQSQTDEYLNYEDNIVPNRPSSFLSSPMQVDPSLEYSDQLIAYNVGQPEHASSSTPSPLNEMVTTVAPSQPSDGLGMQDDQVFYTDFQPTSSPQSDSQMYDPSNFVPASSESQPDNYVNYEDKTVSYQASSTLSPPVQIEPSVEYSDEVAVYDIREPLPGTTTLSPVVIETVPSSIVTTLSPPSLSSEPISVQPSSSASQSDSDEEYDDETALEEFLTTLSPSVQVDPSVEYSDEVAVYNVRGPLPGTTTLPPIVSENILSSEVTTLSPSDTQSESDEDYEDETVSTPSPVTDYEPSVEISDEFSIYNVRQRPSEMTTPSPFTNNVISNFMTTLSPYFTFEESSSKDSLNTISQTTLPPKYEPDMYDDESSVQPSQSSEDDSQPISDETASKDFLPETLSNFDEQTISNVIQSTQSPDLSNQLYGENEVEYPKVSFITVQPTSVPSDSAFEPKAQQEFDYQPTLSPDYETHEETMTTPPSSRQSQDNYVVYEDQIVTNELTTSSPVNEPSLEYSDQLAINNALLPETSAPYSTSTAPFLRDTYTAPTSSETYTDYEGSTANLNSPPTPRNPGQVQTSTPPQPQFVNYDYYNDQNQKPEGSSASKPTTEIDTTITLTEFGPTLPPNFESQVFDKLDSDESSETQANNYVDYEDSVVTTQMPSSTSPQTNAQPSIESSDEILIYNVRKPYFEPTSIQPSSSFEPQPDHYDTYEDQVIVNELSTPSTSQKIENTVAQPTPALEEPTLMYDEPTSAPATLKPQQDNYVNYDNEIISYQPMTSTPSTNQVQPSAEYSDELAVYDVRESLPGTTTLPPVTSGNIASSVVTTPSPPSLSLEPISVQPSISESQSESDEEYDDETPSEAYPTTLSPPVQVEPSVEYSDEVAVYNVRQPLPGTTTLPPVVNENVANSVVSTLPPSSSSLTVEPISIQPSINIQSDSYIYEDYKDETVSKGPVTTLSTPVQVEPSVEYYDEVAVYNVRGPLPGTTTLPPIVSENILSSEVTTLSPSDTQSESDEDYEDETVSTPSPVTDYEPSVEISDEFSIYNVRQRPSEMTTPSPFTNNVISNLMTTLSPYFTSSPNYIDEPKFTPEEELKSYDDSISAQKSSSVAQPDNYASYEDMIVSNDLPTSLPPTTVGQPSIENSDELTIYDVRQPSTASPLSSVSYLEASSTQTPFASEPQPDNYVSYEDGKPSTQTPTTSPQSQENEYLEYSDQLAVYNVREPLPSTTTLSPVVTSSIQPSTLESDSDERYDDDVEQQTSTLPSPQIQENEYLEYSDQLAVNNVREQLPSTTTSSPVVTSSIQPSASQSDNYVNYENDFVPNQVPATSSPKHEEEQYLEYSDQLAVYNVREPLLSTTTSSPVVTSSVQPSASESDSDENYDDDVEQQTSTLPSPQPVDEQYLEYSDQLAVYNVRDQLPNTTTLSPLITSSTRPSASQSDSYVNYETEFVPNQVPTTSSPKHEDQQYLEYSDQLAVYNVREPLPSTTTSSPLVTSSVQPSTSESDNDESYDDEDVVQQTSTLSSPQPGDEQYLEYSDQLAVYNVRDQLPSTTTSSPLVTSSIQPSASQSDSYVNYETEFVPNQVPTTSSPKHEDQQYLEYSDQLAIYNVREPLPSTTTSSPLVTSTLQPSALESDNDESYEDDVEQQTSTLPSPQPQENEYLEYSDQLAVYNVRGQLPSTTTSSPLVTSSIQPTASQSDSYVNYETEFVPNQVPTTSSPKHEGEQYLEYSDQLAVYNVREPLPSTTTSSPTVSENITSYVMPTSSPLFESDKLVTYENEPVQTESQSTFTPQYEQIYDETKTTQSSFDSQPGSYEEYQDKLPTTIPPSQDITTSFSNSIVPTAAPSVGYDYDNQLEYTDSQTIVSTDTSPQISNEPTSIQPLPSSESQPEQYVNYEDERLPVPLPTSTLSTSEVEPSLEYSDQLAVYNVREPLPGSTTLPPIQSDSDEEYDDETSSEAFPTTLSPPVQVEPFIEYSDEVAVYNVRQPLFTSTSPPVISQNVAYSVVTTLPPSPSSLSVEPISVQPSISESQSESDEDYEDETASNEFSTTLSPPVQVEPSVEYSDEVAVYNVREPLPGTTTSAPVVDENIANGLITTLSPSPSNLQSASYSYVDYKDETVSEETPTTLSTPIQVEPSLEYSDEVIINNVRQPEYYSSSTENFVNDSVTTVTPSLGGFETYDNQVVYTDFQPTSSPQSDSQMYDEPTSIPDSSSEPQTVNYVNYEDKTASNVAVTSASPPVDVDVEYSDEFTIYNVRQPSTAPPLLSDITTTPSSSTPDYYSSEMPTSSPVSDSDRTYIVTDEISFVREPESDSHVKAPNTFTTLPPVPQNPVGLEQNDYYMYDDQTDSQTTLSPEIEIEYDQAPTPLEPQSPSSTQSPLEAMVTTLQPQMESQIKRIENKTSTPSNPQEASTFLPLHSFIPLNQPSYPLPEESKPISEQQDQVIPNQVIFSPLVPSSALDSDKQSNYFSNLVQSQETRPNDGIENVQRVTPQPEPLALVPDQTNPSNEPGEDYVSCTCTRGNGKASQHTLMCPFNPVLKGNMTAPSYYILISKLSGGSCNQSLPDEDHFQVERVYLGDGTPLNCTDERKAFPTSKYTPVPIASARTVKLPIRLNNA